jgi:DNA-binding NarL/FixJ family response regulator
VIRILVVAASAIVRAGLEALLAASPTLAVVSHASDWTTLARQVEDIHPDVVLLDVDVYDDDTAAVLQAMGAGARPPALVVLTDDAHGAWVAEALRAGVRAIVLRQALASELVTAIEAAVAGLVVLHPEAVDALLLAAPSASRALVGTPLPTLTPREIEVLSMMAEGGGNKEIAWRLTISEHTVKFHISSIFAKLNTTSRTEAVTVGIRQGLIPL